MKVKVYTIGKKHLIGTYEARHIYDPTFYFRKMPTLSAKSCRVILDTLYPNGKINDALLVLEYADTGHTGMHNIYRRGTILNF